MSTAMGVPLLLLESDFLPNGEAADAPPEAWLEAIVRIHDVPHHCEAIAVRLTAEGGHEAFSPQLQERLTAGCPAATTMRWATVPIGAHDYVLFITPFPA